MPRRPRSLLPAVGVFHVTVRGVEKRSIYLDDDDRREFMRLLRQVVVRFGWKCPAYCLMGNHYHLIVETELASLSAGQHRLNGLYAQGFNERHDRVGHLFQNRFASRVIGDDEYLTDAIEYVWNNPVRAGLCLEAHHWPWSGTLRSTAPSGAIRSVARVNRGERRGPRADR